MQYHDTRVDDFPDSPPLFCSMDKNMKMLEGLLAMVSRRLGVKASRDIFMQVYGYKDPM